jgi:hypothetical protein
MKETTLSTTIIQTPLKVSLLSIEQVQVQRVRSCREMISMAIDVRKLRKAVLMRGYLIVENQTIIQ